jgi:hypothetical protein|nr:MAG TPA: hypothetical protein [Caudoviricetes sp.]
MGSEQKPKERVPLKEIQAKRQRARIVGKFCGYASLVFFIDFMYFFFKLQLSGRLHGAAGYIVASLLVIAMAFHFGKMRAVYVYHHTYKVMQQKLLSKFKERMIVFSYYGWYFSTFIIVILGTIIWGAGCDSPWLVYPFFALIVVAFISCVILSAFTDEFDCWPCYYPWFPPYY